MNAQQIEVINDCEIVGYRNRTKQFLLQCTKCGNQFVRNRTTSQLAEMLGINYNTLYSKLRKERLNNECK